MSIRVVVIIAGLAGLAGCGLVVRPTLTPVTAPEQILMAVDALRDFSARATDLAPEQATAIATFSAMADQALASRPANWFATVRDAWQGLRTQLADQVADQDVSVALDVLATVMVPR